jgi:N-acyl homoserine lactone hydrolase
MRLHLLQLAMFPPDDVPVPGYLVRMDDGTNVLVDTGFPREMIGVYRSSEQPMPRMDEEDFVVNRLAGIGVRPEDVAYVVCTHLDGDHAGNHDAFPGAEFVIQRAHLEAARELDRFQGIRRHWDAPGLRYRTVDGDTELLPGIELVESGGHVPGHQSVLVRLPRTGPVLLAIDAIPSSAQMDPEGRELTPFDMPEHEAALRASTRKLLDVAEREGVTLFVRGHDAEQWRTLRKSPEFYE